MSVLRCSYGISTHLSCDARTAQGHHIAEPRRTVALCPTVTHSTTITEVLHDILLPYHHHLSSSLDFSERLPPLFNSSCNPPEPDAETAADIYTYLYISGGQVHRTMGKSVGPSDGRITRSPPELVGMWLHMRRAKPTSSIPTVTPCLVYRLVITCNRLIVIHPATSRYPRMIPERSEWERRSLTLVRGCAIPVLQ